MYGSSIMFDIRPVYFETAQVGNAIMLALVIYVFGWAVNHWAILNRIKVGVKAVIYATPGLNKELLINPGPSDGEEIAVVKKEPINRRMLFEKMKRCTRINVQSEQGQT